MPRMGTSMAAKPAWSMAVATACIMPVRQPEAHRLCDPSRNVVSINRTSMAVWLPWRRGSIAQLNPIINGRNVHLPTVTRHPQRSTGPGLYRSGIQPAHHFAQYQPVGLDVDHGDVGEY